MSNLIAVWDIDGTLANNEHRAKLLKKRCSVCLHEPLPSVHRAVCPTCGSTDSTITKESWDAFLAPELMLLDTPILDALRVLDKLRSMGAETHFITARSFDNHLEATATWLRKYVRRASDDSEILHMRLKEDEGIPASQYKARALSRLKKQIGEEGCFMFFDDDPHVLKMYQEHGLVIKCPEALKYFKSNPIHSEINYRA